MKVICICILMLLVGCVVARKDWALLIAGSNTYDNYRHQADICHAYQILHKNGIPDERIVVMMYDDIAHNKYNPYPGTIINKPGGPNVYAGVPKDYTGKDVIPKVFFAALQGQKDKIKELTGRSGKVIDSGPDDHIFVYFADHGAPGLLAMPGDAPVIKATDLNKVLKSMYNNKRFARLVFYVEACESGSVFDKLLPDSINIYVTTAANPYESSFAIYWSSKYNTYLGDLYSVAWMEDTDSHNVNKENFEIQYERVKKRTIFSHVQQYGDLTFTKDVLSDFFSKQKSENMTIEKELNVSPTPISDAIPSEMVPMMILKNRIAESPANSELRRKLEGELANLQRTIWRTSDLFWTIAGTADPQFHDEEVYREFLDHREDIENWTCYDTALDILVEVCPGLKLNNNDAALRKLYTLVSLCNKIPQKKIIFAIESAASVNPVCSL